MHVLLDSKGKTLSHAFVEVADENIAKTLLRTTQNSVLGKGKRARGVTVTMSGQAELMRAVSRCILAATSVSLTKASSAFPVLEG